MYYIFMSESVPDKSAISVAWGLNWKSKIHTEKYKENHAILWDKQKWHTDEMCGQ